jgi:NAD(P)-dependent dehydrogenase (short-subunit alcohol dehydrogenase family)
MSNASPQGLTSVVITGSTRGIGHAVANELLACGCRVMISGRIQQTVTSAVGKLAARHGAERVAGTQCDVGDPVQVQALWDAAKAKFGQIDIWINNAGIGHATQPTWELSPTELKAVVDTNVMGTLYGARVALRGMLEQGSGALYNLEGLGSDGRVIQGVVLYGSTKAQIHYLTSGLMRETRGTKIKVGAIQPGMVWTDLIAKRYEGKPDELQKVKKIFNLICNRVDDVAPWVAEKILQNRRRCVRFNYMPGHKVLWRFLSAPFTKRSVIE